MPNFTYYADLQGIQLSEVGGKTVSWLKIMNHGEYNHMFHGKLTFDATRTKRFAENVKQRVRGQDPDIDFDHKLDPAKGNKAAGWVKDAESRADGLYAFIEWTPTAVQEIRDGEWRYISPEYRDEWEDNQGHKFTDVLFGAGLTNRPFLKDLMPINLSELAFKFDDPTKSNPEEKEVDPKQLRERLGLPADATDADVTARCALLKQLSEAFPGGVPTPPVVPPAPEPPKPTIELTGDIKKLAEENPSLKALLEYTENQMRQNADYAKQLREAQVSQKLSEFDASKITLTPVARTLVQEIMLHEGLPAPLQAKIWELMDAMKTGHSFFVELGERAGVNVRYGRLDNQSATERVIKLQEELVVNQKLSIAAAYEKIAKDDPALFEEYRQEATAFHA